MSFAHDPTHAGRVLDLAVIEELRELGGAEDPGLLLELIETFLEDAPRHLSEMTCAFDDIDHERMLRAAHTLKSSSANMGSLALSDACREMERAAQAGDMNEYRRMTEVCLTAYREFEAALREIS